MSNTSMNIRMDSEVKRQAEALFSEFGINMTTAVNMFLRQSIRQQAIPFSISLDVPNSETMAAMEEVKRMKNNPNKKTYADFAELLKEVEADV